MTSDFAAEVVQWQSAYILIGGMAATLTGLLFVAVSINLRTIITRANNAATRTLIQFLLIIELSIVFQIPGQSAVTLGASVLLLSLFALATVVYSARRGHGRRPPPIRELVPSFLLFLAFVVVGALIMTGSFDLLFVMVSLVIMTMISAVFSAWALLVEADVEDDESGDVPQSS